MMRNENGITLTMLVITIIILTLLISVGINFGYERLDDVRDSKYTTQLGIVRQGVVEQYQKALAVNQTEKTVSEEPVIYWIGERIYDATTINLPESGFIETIDTEEFYNRTENYICEYQEDYYYRLTPEDLEKIGIGDSKDNYIVNYSTGEVYNEKRQVNSKEELLYLPIIKHNNSINEDNSSFNDWN